MDGEVDEIAAFINFPGNGGILAGIAGYMDKEPGKEGSQRHQQQKKNDPGMPAVKMSITHFRIGL